MLKRFIAILAATIAAATAQPSLAQTDPTTTAGDLTSGELRDVRYCELIVAQRSGLSVTATVYNSLGLNDCPQDLWSQITAAQVTAQFDAMGTVINGPRYWVLDGIAAADATARGTTVTVGGIALTARATLDLGLLDLRSKPYEPRQVNRTTQWFYTAGRPMFLLQDPDGTRYAMQSYARIVDTDLAYDDLAGLAARLKLPDGWTFSTTTPDQDLTYPALGLAIVVQDDLENTYQKLP